MTQPLFEKNETLREEINAATHSLLQIARESCYNSISDNVQYVLQIADQKLENGNFYQQFKLKKKLIQSSPRLQSEALLNQLYSIYDQIHQMDLYIHKAEKRLTLVEVNVTGWPGQTIV